MELLRDFIFILLSSIVVLLLLSRLKVPTIIGFLLTGIIIGPHALNLVKSEHEIEILAEIGVMLLMFNIGLEFSLNKIKSMKYEVLVIGGLQFVITALTVIGVMAVAGFNAAETIFASFLISLSSTAIVLKILQDKGQVQTPYGRVMVGILLFQDLCVVPLIIFTPILSTIDTVSFFPIALKLAKSFGLIILIFFLAKFLLPKAFDFISGLRINELFMSLVLALCIGLALLTQGLGFSLALGSFIAGMILAESDFHHQIEADIKPLKNVFLTIFFISVGLLLNLTYVWKNVGIVVGGTLAIIIVKTLVIALITLFARRPLNLSLMIGLGLAQIGEFAFLLLNIAQPLNIISEAYYQYFLSVSIITMLLTPVLYHAGSVIAGREALKKDVEGVVKSLSGHVIIAGFGINGLILSKIFKTLNIPYKIIEMNPKTVKKYKFKGENIVFGDLTKAENLKLMGIEKAKMMVIAISDPEATSKAVKISRELNPDIHITVRADYISQLEQLNKKGADAVVSQDFEAALEISSYIMAHYGVAPSIIKIKADHLRKLNYSIDLHSDHTVPLHVTDLLSITNVTETYLVLAGSGLAGKRLDEISFDTVGRKVFVTGLIREGMLISHPEGDPKVQVMDSIVIYGHQSMMEAALKYLDNFEANVKSQ